VGMLFWTHVYVAHAISLRRLAETASNHVPYAFDLNQFVIAPNFIHLSWVLAVAIPVLSGLMFARNKKLIFIRSSRVKTTSAKFLAILSVVFLLLFPSSIGFIVLQWMKGGLDAGMLFGAYLGMFLIAIFFILLSMAILSQVKNWWLALCASLFLCVVLCMLGLPQVETPVWLKRFLPAEILGEFSRGVIDLRPFGARINLAESEQIFLSKHTENILKQFGDDAILITAFLSSERPDFKNAQNLLREYARVNPHLKYKIYDPDRQAAEALKHRIDAYGSTVIEVRGKKAAASFPDEDKITNALSGILENKSRRILFTIGHSEPGLGDKSENGYENLAAKIRSLGFELEESGLTDIQNLSNADLILLTGPHSDLNEREAEVLRRHFESGGSVFVAVDPVFPREGDRTRQLIWALGVDLGRDVVIDKYSKLNGVEKLVVVITNYAEHPGIRDFSKPVLMPVARSVRKRANVPDDVAVTEIARTGKGSWAETNLIDLENDKAEYNEKEDLAGPIPVASVLEQTKSKGKMVIIGDSEWLNNASFGLLGNRDFFISLLGWLTSDVISREPVRIPEPNTREPFVLHGREHAVIFSMSVFLTPVLLLVAGFLTFTAGKR